ncbi:MAG TPA: UDP-N-acetylmuramoyl-L-alanine--D-glutamate ligase [Syntrophothermus lipocalidus]|nr:UDP-N-acetylmuramoyl-L-alanine--D-glutamate ligase [Syntrophothermus lipocalidus]
MKIRGKRFIVIGLAKSGVAVARTLARRGGRVTVYDQKAEEQLGKALAELAEFDVKKVLGEELTIKPGEYDLAVVSPGVSMDAEVVRRVIEAGTPVIGEIELAYHLKNDAVEIVAITGTNGKTTTTAFVAEILDKSGVNTAACGNIGVPLISVIDEIEHGVVSVEVSSFQLETIREFHPRVAAVLNITPDHLDRHGTMEQYVEAKAKILSNQGPDDFSVLNYEDAWVRRLKTEAKSQVIFFSTARRLPRGVYVEDGKIKARLYDDEVVICPRENVALRGEHNLENVLCAVGIAIALGVKPDTIADTLRSFKGVRHRLEEVRRVNGVLYVNDSKGTNPESTIKALQAFQEPVILIAGGRNKGADFTVLSRVIKDKVRHLVLVGEASLLIREKVLEQGFQHIDVAKSFEEAVYRAKELARPGDVVLLSPACASWDMFNSFEERGDLFCQLVNSLEEERV